MRRAIVGLVVAVQAVVCASSAMGLATARSNYPPGSDPSSNFPVPAHGLPFACLDSPKSPACINAAVYYLDKGRVRLGQPAYKLPADFAQLTPPEQAFILTNLDRDLYGLWPLTGLTSTLNQESYKSSGGTAGIWTDSDPIPTDSNLAGWASNWAGAFPNMVLAYEAWVYDDGYGSNNIDCTSPGASGCWGHRHDVLYVIPSGYETAMGAAVGKDEHGTTGYAMIVGAYSGFTPTYSYTWTTAQNDGAGTNSYPVSKPAAAALRVSLSTIGSTLIATIKPPAGKSSVGSNLHCSLVRQSSGKLPADNFSSCGKTVSYRNIKSGTYQFDVTSSIGWARYDFSLSSGARDVAADSASVHHERLITR